MIRKLDIPRFRSEAEEAEWWDSHREDATKWIEDAVSARETTTLPAVLQRTRARTRLPGRVFISHSSQDKVFAGLVAARLREHDMEPWIDTARISVGDDIFDTLGDGLKASDVFVFLLSNAALQSGWVEREVKFAAKRQIKENHILILPFIIDETPVEVMPWFLASLNVRRVRADALGAAEAAAAAWRALQARITSAASAPSAQFQRDARIDKLVAGVKFLDREAAAAAAIEIVKATDPSGRNDLFEALLSYQDYPDDHDLLMRILSIIEGCAELAPSLIDHRVLARMSDNPEFSVRSSAASICMNLAQFAPDRAPVDILIRLSVHDEDWYVQAPANAALKAMARALPAVLQIFLGRLHSTDADEREHAAHALWEVAEKEPEILDAEELQRELLRLRSLRDKESAHYLADALSKVNQVTHASGYKYGI